MGSFLSSGGGTISAPPAPLEDAKIDPQHPENEPTAEIIKSPQQDPKPVTNPATLPTKPTSTSKPTGPKATVTTETNSLTKPSLKRKNMDDSNEEDEVENNNNDDDGDNDDNNDNDSDSESDVAFEINNDSKASDDDDEEEEGIDGNEASQPKKLPSDEIFKGITFAISGLLSQSHIETVEMIKGHGGSYASVYNKKVTHLLTTEDEIESRSKKVEAAKEAGIKIISEEYLHDCIHESARLDEKDYSLVKDKKRKTAE